MESFSVIKYCICIFIALAIVIFPVAVAVYRIKEAEGIIPCLPLIIYTCLGLAFFVFFAITNPSHVVETNEKYEVVQIIDQEVICINEKNELITESLYDICYDENAQNMYAVKMSSERYFTLGVLDKDKGEHWFRVYTNNKSYVEAQSIYCVMEK